MNEPPKPEVAATIAFADAAAFEVWLANNYQNQTGIWVKVAKKASGIPSITEDELVDVGLCWGWISGQRKPLDENYYLQKYVPRRKRSLWSQINVDKVAELTEAGRMRAPGLAEVEVAKADGRWQSAYASQSNAQLPQDLLDALADNVKALERLNVMNRTEQYAIYFQLATARTEANRSVRFKKIITQLSEIES